MSTEPANSTPSFSTGRRWFIGFHVLLAVAAVAVILLSVNYLALRHYSRYHVSDTGQGQFTPTTLQVLKSLTNDVRVIIYFNPEEPMYPYVSAMLKEYAALSSHIKLESVNYATEPARAAELINQFRLGPGSRDMVMFAVGDRMEYVSEGQLWEKDISDLLQGKGNEVRRKSFLGELYFTAKLLSVSSAKPYHAYYLTGHKEHDPKQDSELGYKKFIDLLAAGNVRSDTLDLQRTKEVPADCDLLIIAGPIHEPTNEELERVEAYLNSGGRLLILLNVQTRPGWERLLAKWGVATGQDVVFDSPNMQESGVLMVENKSSHPITQSRDRLYLFFPRSVGKMPGLAVQVDSAQVTELFSTGPAGEARTDFRQGVLTPYLNPMDRKGEIPLAVAVEKGGLKNVTLQRGTTRLIVVGDSHLLDNQYMITPGNEEFARQSINWLLDRSFLLGAIGPRAFTEYQLSVSNSQMTLLRWIMLGAMPGGVFAFGLLVWLRRRR